MKNKIKITFTALFAASIVMSCGSTDSKNKNENKIEGESKKEIEQITSEGLILLLDASESQSYNGNGNLWKDLSGQNNNGKLINAPSFDTTSVKSFFIVPGSRIDIDGTNFKIDQVTWSIWIKTSNKSNNFMEIMSLATSNESLSNGAHLFIGNSRAAFSVKNNRNNFILKNNELGEVSDNKWHNIVISFSKNKKCTGYFDGVLVSKTPLSNWEWTSSNLLRVCGRLSHWSEADEFTGHVSHLAIYNRILSDKEVEQNYKILKKRHTK